MRLSSRCCAVVAGVLVVASPAAAQPDPFVGAPGLGDPYYPLDGNGGYDVGHYDVAIDYDPPSRHLIGKVRVEARATQALRAFNLDFSGPDVQMVTVNGRPAGWDR